MHLFKKLRVKFKVIFCKLSLPVFISLILACVSNEVLERGSSVRVGSTPKTTTILFDPLYKIEIKAKRGVGFLK